LDNNLELTGIAACCMWGYS